MTHNFEIEGAWNISHAAVTWRGANVVGFHRWEQVMEAMSQTAPKNLLWCTISLNFHWRWGLNSSY